MALSGGDNVGHRGPFGHRGGEELRFLLSEPNLTRFVCTSRSPSTLVKEIKGKLPKAEISRGKKDGKGTESRDSRDTHPVPVLREYPQRRMNLPPPCESPNP